VSRWIITLSFLSALGWAGAAGAAPPERCPGPPAQAGQVVHGPVLQVPDGSTLCVALGPSPEAWTGIRLSPSRATRSELMAAAFGKNATCSLDSDGRGRCLIEGEALDDKLRSAEVRQAAPFWR
jgi:hypothetical protein